MPPPGVSPPDAGQRAERVRERHDLAGAPDAGARHGREDSRVQQIHQPLAQPGRHSRVPGQERAQPHRDERPRVGGVQPGRAAGRPGEQQVALVGALLLFGEAHAHQRAHAGVHSVNRAAVAQHGTGLVAAPLDRTGQPGCDRDRLPGRDLADECGVEAGRGGDRQYRHRHG